MNKLHANTLRIDLILGGLYECRQGNIEVDIDKMLDELIKCYIEKFDAKNHLAVMYPYGDWAEPENIKFIK